MSWGPPLGMVGAECFPGRRLARWVLEVQSSAFGEQSATQEPWGGHGGRADGSHTWGCVPAGDLGPGGQALLSGAHLGQSPTLEGVLWCRCRARLDSGDQPGDQNPGRGSTGESDGSWVRAGGMVGGMVRWNIRWRAR